MKTLKIMSLLLVFLFIGTVSFGQKQQTEKLQKSTAVLKSFTGMEGDMSSRLMQKAQGVVIIPNLVKAGLGIGGQRGKGVAMVKKADGTWSNPVFVTLTGGSIGFQAGVQAIDLVLVFIKGTALSSLEKGEFTIGGDVSVAAGPVGRSSSANTDIDLDAEVYSYSRSKGLFAGIALDGSRLSADDSANKNFYKVGYKPSSIFNAKKSTKTEVVELKKALRNF